MVLRRSGPAGDGPGPPRWHAHRLEERREPGPRCLSGWLQRRDPLPPHRASPLAGLSDGRPPLRFLPADEPAVARPRQAGPGRARLPPRNPLGRFGPSTVALRAFGAARYRPRAQSRPTLASKRPGTAPVPPARSDRGVPPREPDRY